VLNIVCDFIYHPSLGENVVVFDHHDPATNDGRCSAHKLMDELVLQGMMCEIPALMEQVSLWDVVGPQAIPVNDRPDPDKYTAVLAAEPEEGFDSETARFILEKLSESGTMREFIDELFFAENKLGKTARRIHTEILAKREEALAEIISKAVVCQSPSGINYATLYKNPAGLTNELFKRLQLNGLPVDILIHPNERNEDAFSIVRDSDGRYATTPVAELVEVTADKIVFCHPGGFLLVAEPPFSIR